MTAIFGHGYFHYFGGIVCNGIAIDADDYHNAYVGLNDPTIAH